MMIAKNFTLWYYYFWKSSKQIVYAIVYTAFRYKLVPKF